MAKRQDEQTQKGSAHESWVVPLHGLPQEAVDIFVRRTRPMTGETSVWLASLPDAATQRGILTIRANRLTPWHVVRERLEPIPSAPAGFGRLSTIRGMFRFNPVQEVRDQATAPLVLVPQSPDSQISDSQTLDSQTRGADWSPTFIWRHEVDVWRAPGGTTDYLATFSIENGGSGIADIHLPQRAVIVGLWVDNQEISATLLSSDPPLVEVNLPSQQRFSVVAIRYRLQEKPLGTVGRITIRPPTTRLPVLGQQMTLWLPPAYDAYGRHTISLSEPATVGQRLFGPLGRSRYMAAFNPLEG